MKNVTTDFPGFGIWDVSFVTNCLCYFPFSDFSGGHQEILFDSCGPFPLEFVSDLLLLFGVVIWPGSLQRDSHGLSLRFCHQARKSNCDFSMAIVAAELLAKRW